MTEKAGMPTPIAGELLIDPEASGDRDERFPGVHLLAVDESGEGKTTAARMPNGWRISDWELTEELEGRLAGARYWYCSSFVTLPVAHLHMLSLLETEHLNSSTPGDAGDLPFEVLPTDPPPQWSIAPSADGGQDARAEVELFCLRCSDADDKLHPLTYPKGSPIAIGPDLQPACLKCGKPLSDLLPF